MAGIGETLRETRMRRRIDMTEVETATKIRAKYLRALENEEWAALPGPTFVKSFLRTYAEYLGLDARALVDDYRQRFERAPGPQELTPFGPGLGAEGRRRRPPRAPVGPVLLVVVVFAGLLAALYFLGISGDDTESPAPPPRTDTPVAADTPTPTPTAKATATPHKKKRRTRRRPVRPTRATVRITATSTVWACLVDATGRAVVDARVLSAGQSTATFRSQRFVSNFGNGNVRFRVNGRTYRVPASSNPVGYELRPGRAPTRISDAARSGLCA